MNNSHLMVRSLGRLLLCMAPEDMGQLQFPVAEESLSGVLRWRLPAWRKVLLQILPSFAFQWDFRAGLLFEWKSCIPQSALAFAGVVRLCSTCLV